MIRSEAFRYEAVNQQQKPTPQEMGNSLKPSLLFPKSLEILDQVTKVLYARDTCVAWQIRGKSNVTDMRLQETFKIKDSEKKQKLDNSPIILDAFRLNISFYTPIPTLPRLDAETNHPIPRFCCDSSVMVETWPIAGALLKIRKFIQVCLGCDFFCWFLGFQYFVWDEQNNIKSQSKNHIKSQI